MNYTDHLGNIRLSYTKEILPGNGSNLKILEEIEFTRFANNPEIINNSEQNNYYPFGLKHGLYNTPARDIRPVIDNREIEMVSDNPYQYKYQGQERQNELGLNWDSFKWRNYDYALGRFMNPDALSELAPMHTPYRFGFNNPFFWSDPTGLYELNADGLKVNGKEEHEVLMNFFYSWDGEGDFMELAMSALDAAGFGLEIVHLDDMVFQAKSSKSKSNVDNKTEAVLSETLIESRNENNLDQLNDGLTAFGIGNSTKTGLIEYAGKTGELSKGTQNYLRAFRGVGYLGAGINAGYAGYQLYENPTAGNATRLAVQGLAIGAVFIPGVGWAISLGIGAVDMIWGDQLYEWIDNQ